MDVMAAPQKVGRGLRRSLASIKRSGAHVVGLTEMDLGDRDYLPVAQQVLGRMWKVLARDRGEHSREIPILVHLLPWIKIVSHVTVKLSDDIQGKGAGNDRWLNILRIKVWGKLWIIMNIHTNAEVQRVGHIPHDLVQGPRLDAYLKGMKKLERHIADALVEADGRVVTMGDFNMLDADDGETWEWSPHQVFSRLGMTWISERVVYVAWGPGLRAVGKPWVTKANTVTNPADHARLRQKLKRAA